MNVKTCGYLFGGREKTFNLSAGSTISSLAVEMGMPDVSAAKFVVDGVQADGSFKLYDGAYVAYAMTNIKGA